jgi:hypothetical protein
LGEGGIEAKPQIWKQRFKSDSRISKIFARADSQSGGLGNMSLVMKRDIETAKRKIEQLDCEILESREREQAALGELQDSVTRTIVRSHRKAAAADVRSRRTGRLWRLGVRGESAGILGMDSETLLGALRAASAFRTNAHWQQKWAEAGRELAARALAMEKAKAKPVSKNPDKALQEMKARAALNQKRIAFGGVVDKAGLADWDHDALLGLFAMIARHFHDAERLQRWKAAGAAAAVNPSVQRKGAAKKGRRPRRVEIQYPAAIPPDLAQELRALGLKFDRATLVWRGFASMPVARRYAKKGGGNVIAMAKTGGKPRKIRTQKNSGNRRARSPGDANINSEATNKERKS